MIIIVPDWLTTFNAIWIFIGALIFIALAVIVFLSKRKDETLVIEQKNSEANARLVKARDDEIKDLVKKLEKAETEVEDVTAEYRSIVGIDIQKLLEYWQIREHELALMVKLRAENRILRQAAGLGETEDVIHTTKG